jgi:hypothetical protein
MFGSSCAGIRPLAVSAGVAVSLAISAGSAMSQAVPEVVPRAAVAMQLPVAPYIPFKEVMAAPMASTSVYPGSHIAAALASGTTQALAQDAPGPHSSSGHAQSISKATSTNRWEVRTSDITLYRTLERWSSAAGYKLKWDAAKNFLIGAPDVYAGSFESALQSVLSSSGIRLSDYPLEACIYANTPPLVRITRQGEQARECSAVE